MPWKRKRSFNVPIVASLLLLLLLSLYVGAYYATVSPGIGFWDEEYYCWTAQYSISEEFYRWDSVPYKFFYPVHILDRKLRPEYWEIHPALPTYDRLPYDVPASSSGDGTVDSLP